MIDMAGFFAKRLEKEAGNNATAQVKHAYLLAFARHPISDELAAAKSLIEQHGLLVFCRALFNANELVYVH